MRAAHVKHANGALVLETGSGQCAIDFLVLGRDEAAALHLRWTVAIEVAG
ncbi:MULTISPECIES: hypothetical protein [Burkholderia]|nr:MULTISPECIES: hypothetical protein [Burkholderia]